MSDQDPAVRGWQAATEAHMAASTSAIGRNLQTALDQLRDEYNAELLELSAARARSNWIVARDGGRDCERCAQEIRRGEAYQHLGVDDLRHVHCPRPRKHLDAVKRERDDALAEVSRLRASNQTEATDG